MGDSANAVHATAISGILSTRVPKCALLIIAINVFPYGLGQRRPQSQPGPLWPTGCEARMRLTYCIQGGHAVCTPTYAARWSSGCRQYSSTSQSRPRPATAGTATQSGTQQFSHSCRQAIDVFLCVAGNRSHCCAASRTAAGGVEAREPSDWSREAGISTGIPPRAKSCPDRREIVHGSRPPTHEQLSLGMVVPMLEMTRGRKIATSKSLRHVLVNGQNKTVNKRLTGI